MNNFRIPFFRLLPVFACALCCTAGPAAAQIRLAAKHKPAARLVLTTPDPADSVAASLLQRFVRRISDAELPIVAADDLRRAPGAGDVLIGMASSGVHSNGFSLVRKVFEMTKESLDTYYEELGGTLGETLITPTRIYVKALKSIKESGVRIKGCSHITGGGFYENIPRMLPEGVNAVIEKDSYEIPPVFGLLARKGQITEEMMYNTFNMGLGMVVAVDPSDADRTMEAVRAAGEQPYVVGRIEAGEKGVTLC